MAEAGELTGSELLGQVGKVKTCFPRNTKAKDVVIAVTDMQSLVMMYWMFDADKAMKSGIVCLH